MRHERELQPHSAPDAAPAERRDARLGMQAQAVLALQRSAGNLATTRWLGREGAEPAQDQDSAAYDAALADVRRAVADIDLSRVKIQRAVWEHDYKRVRAELDPLTDATNRLDAAGDRLPEGDPLHQAIKRERDSLTQALLYLTGLEHPHWQYHETRDLIGYALGLLRAHTPHGEPLEVAPEQARFRSAVWTLEGVHYRIEHTKTPQQIGAEVDALGAATAELDAACDALPETDPRRRARDEGRDSLVQAQLYLTGFKHPRWQVDELLTLIEVAVGSIRRAQR